MTSVLWTEQARDDLAAIRAFIEQDSPHYAIVVIARLIPAADQIAEFPQSGRVVPEWNQADVREIVHAPYRIVYRVVSDLETHVLTVHHGAQRMPETAPSSQSHRLPQP